MKPLPGPRSGTAFPGLLRLSLVFLPAVLLCGCPPVEAIDYYQLAVGNQWEYFVTQGGVEGEVWNMEIFDADANPDSGRGDIYLLMNHTTPPNEGNPQALTLPERSFNLAAQQDLTGSVAKLIGWQYKVVEEDEGDRNEYFVKAPGSADDWSGSWDYRVSDSGAAMDFAFSVNADRMTDPVQTPYGTYVDYVRCIREVRIEHSDGTEGNRELVEDWASGVGLIRYQVTGVDGDVTEVLLRTTNVAEIPGS